MEQLRSLSQVRVQKDYLIEKLTENRKGHRAEFEKAHEDWHEAVVDWFVEQRELAVKNKRFLTWFDLPEPVDHTAEYDQALEMLDASQDDEFVISQQEFRQYVRDDWAWQAETKEQYQTASTYNALRKR